MIKHLFFFISFCLCLVVFSSPSSAKKEKKEKEATEAGAKPAQVLGVGPPIFELECKPGEKKTLTLKVDNPNPLPTGVSLQPHGLVTAGYTEVVARPIASLPPNALGRHIIIESGSIVVPARSYKNVAVTIDVPEGLTGTQYVGLTAASSGATDEPGVVRKSEYEMGVELGMLPALGVTIKCHMAGTMNYSYVLEKLAVKPPQGNEPTTLTGTLKNTGNGEIIITPTLILLDSTRKVAARLKASSRVTMVPGGTYHVSFQSLFSQVASGKYEAVLSPDDPKYQLPPITREVVVR
ncbi:MAG: hypothetical protein HY541_02935 [Deltaproteobacteria bacterium]|nr:hypothetical protein [Deltaproteobacteria bacterium]